MNNKHPQNTARRHIAYLSPYGTTQLHLRNPLVIAWWSAAFPGLGHLLLSKYIRGFLLFIWEVVINYKAQVNLAIYYSLIGEINKGISVIDKEWMLLYFPTYIFAIWDSYRTTVDINNTYRLAAREDAPIKHFTITAMEINYLDKRLPWAAFIWSLLMPGTGQLYIHRIITAAFTIIWWIVVASMSKIAPAIHYSLLGNIAQAKSVLDIQWVLNIPSIYMFAVYDAYVNTVENNKLFDWDLSKFLKQNYQPPHFFIPTGSKKSQEDAMHIVATFEYTKYLELAITELEMKGVYKEQILAVPMDARGEDRNFFDTIHYSDGLSLLDLGAVLGAIFMLLGSIYGFQLRWGPVWWALIGLGIGFLLGFVIKLLVTRKYVKNRRKVVKNSEVVLIIECNSDQLEMAKTILWNHHALGVSKVDIDGEPAAV